MHIAPIQVKFWFKQAQMDTSFNKLLSLTFSSEKELTIFNYHPKWQDTIGFSKWKCLTLLVLKERTWIKLDLFFLLVLTKSQVLSQRLPKPNMATKIWTQINLKISALPDLSFKMMETWWNSWPNFSQISIWFALSLDTSRLKQTKWANICSQ
jgi:hypothetical protein